MRNIPYATMSPLNLSRPIGIDTGRGQGIFRNVERADYADAFIAIWNGKSRGNGHKFDLARNKGLRVFIFQAARETGEIEACLGMGQ